MKMLYRRYLMKMELGQVAVALLVLCAEIMHTAADVIATSPHNDTQRFQSVTAAFGSDPDGQMGWLVEANPSEACQPIDKPPVHLRNTSEMYFALIKRGKCDFDKKVFNAQRQIDCIYSFYSKI
nr:E3 ubiquitin-protein ligase RNF13-like [Lytechinus pictus]